MWGWQSTYCTCYLSSVAGILLSPYPFSYLPVYFVVSLSILLSPCPFCCFTEKRLETRGRIRTEVVNFRSVVFTGIVFHGRYHGSLFNKVCLICPSDVLFKKIMSQIINCVSRNLFLNCPQPKKNKKNQQMALTNNVPVA